MAQTTNRTRSPKYPNFPLGTAVRQIGKIHAADRRNVIERLNAAKHMGYSSLSGPSEKAIGTLVQYGLLELVAKGQVRVAQLAVDILHPVGDGERKAALAKAAYSPEIFKSLREQFPEGVSEASLASYLVRQEFMNRAIGPLSKAYTETLAYLEQSGASDSHRPSPSGAAESEVPDDDADLGGVVYGGAHVGDLVQWESGGVLHLERPTRVRLISDDGQWVAVEGSASWIPMAQTVVEERAALAPPPPPPPPPPAAPTPLLPVEHAKVGMDKDMVSLAEGVVTIDFPKDLTAASVDELEEYFEFFIKKARRRVAQ